MRSDAACALGPLAQAVLAQARVRMGDGPMYPRQLRERHALDRGWCPLYLLPEGAWFKRTDNRGYGLPDDVRVCRVLVPWGGRYFPDDILLVDSWDVQGTLLRVGEPWMAFSGGQPVMDPPAWWPGSTKETP